MEKRRIRFAFAALVIAGAYASPACKSNEVNQTSNTTNNFTTVTSEGGTVPGPDGTSVRIPADALDEPVDIGIVEAKPGEYPETRYGGGAGDTWTPIGKVWAFLPHGLQFFIEPTFRIPAQDGRYDVMKAQPNGAWEFVQYNVAASGGFLQFKSSSFSFYTIKATPGGPSTDGGGDAVTPCDACHDSCRTRCGDDKGCLDDCNADCIPICDGPIGETGGGGGDAKPESDTSVGDTSSCMESCPTSGFGPGALCNYCGTSYPCVGTSGGTELRCNCEPGGKLSGCVPTGGGGDAGGGICPTKPQSEGTGTFTGMTVVDGYAFYNENNLGSSYYSQLWIVLSDKAGTCTRSVSHQGGSNTKTLRVRLEALNTTTPFVFTTGTYANGSTYGVMGDLQGTDSTCGPGGVRENYNNGTVTITSTAGGRYQGTFNFPAMSPFPGGSGTFDLPVCAEDNPGAGGGGGGECCK